METLRAAYEMANRNDGAPGIDGVTFEAIEAQGVEALLEQLRDELIGRTYQPLPAGGRSAPWRRHAWRDGLKNQRIR
jgi:RNA-directed DNA polymerase